jgi:putative transposase
VYGKRDILGIWASPGGEGAKFWLSVLTEVRNRGVRDVCIVACDGLKGLPDAIGVTWPLAVVQTCVLHLIRNTFRYAARQHWDALARDLRPVYTAVNEQAARERFVEFCERWAEHYPAIKALWEHPRTEFVSFLDYPIEVRRVSYSTNAIESLHARMRRATGPGAIPDRASGDEMPLPVVRSLDPTGKGADRWMNRWKPALNTFAIAFEGRLFPAED